MSRVGAVSTGCSEPRAGVRTVISANTFVEAAVHMRFGNAFGLQRWIVVVWLGLAHANDILPGATSSRIFWKNHKTTNFGL